MPEVMVVVHDVTDWIGLGLALGLHYHTLTEIGHRSHRWLPIDYGCLMEIVHAWLERWDHVLQIGVPSWSVLRAALHEIGEHEIADRIVSTSLILLVCAVNKFGPINRSRSICKKTRRGGEGEPSQFDLYSS